MEARYTALGAEKGSHVVVKYTGEASDATVSGVKVVGKGTVKVSEGTVTKVDDAAKTVTVKTASGAEEVYQFSEKVTVDSAKGIAKGTEKGAKVSVYYTEEAGKGRPPTIKHLAGTGGPRGTLALARQSPRQRHERHRRALIRARVIVIPIAGLVSAHLPASRAGRALIGTGVGKVEVARAVAGEFPAAFEAVGAW